VFVRGWLQTRPVVTSALLAAPSWLAVPAASVFDALWLAFGDWRHSRDLHAGGVAVTAAWLCGCRPGPVTERFEGPVTSALAESERVAAQLVLDEWAGAPRFPAEEYCEELGVMFVAPRPVSREWASGAHRTLRWALGRYGSDGRVGPPVPLPRRRDDGSLVPADELYGASLSRAGRMLGPAQRAELRREADLTAARSQRLEARVLELQRAASRG